jgi:hypothetical protein
LGLTRPDAGCWVLGAGKLGGLDAGRLGGQRSVVGELGVRSWELGKEIENSKEERVKTFDSAIDGFLFSNYSFLFVVLAFNAMPYALSA